LALRKIGGDYRLIQNPVAELKALRGQPIERRALSLGEAPVALPIPGASAEFQIELDTQTAKQVLFTLSDGDGHQTLIGVNPSVNEVFVDRTRSGPHFHDGFENRHVAPVDLSSGKVSLHVLFDRSIIELFVNDGIRTITDRVFPTGKAFRWSATAIGGTSTINLITWPIQARVAESADTPRRATEHHQQSR